MQFLKAELPTAILFKILLQLHVGAVLVKRFLQKTSRLLTGGEPVVSDTDGLAELAVSDTISRC